MNKRGFTMVEVIIVVAVIAVLASIIMPKMGGGRDKAKLSACKVNIRHIVVALDLYANDNNGVYCPNTGYTWVNSSCYLITGGYLARVPICPLNTTVAYNYRILDSGYDGGPGIYDSCGSMGMGLTHPGYGVNEPYYSIRRGGFTR